MRNVRRYFKRGQICFVTHVTYGRLPLLVDNFDLLWQSFETHMQKLEFELIAWVVLPDHWHAIIDPQMNDMPSLMKKIKLSFSALYRKRVEARSMRIWQSRYWDHIIRDQNDFNRHIDYIHYNPIKHKIATMPLEYEYSSFREYYDDGIYNEDWAVFKKVELNGDFGESLK